MDIKRNNSPLFDLNEILVFPDNLLLDPNNPRLKDESFDTMHYTQNELASEKLQNQLLTQICGREHEVNRLIESIRVHGYINIDSIFVKRLPLVNKYLVLEGNRRTAAIKQLRKTIPELNKSVAKSIEKIPVKELICRDQRSEKEMTDYILAMRHLGGIKEWSPMQRAHSVYVSYMSELIDNGGKEFTYSSSIARSVADSLNLKTKVVKRGVEISRLFDQLLEKGYAVKQDHYTLIELAISKRNLRESYFEISYVSFLLSSRGMGRFNNLCIEKGCLIKNPADFKSFSFVFDRGTEHDVKLIEQGAESIDTVRNRLEQRLIKKIFRDRLQEVRDLIRSLAPSDYQGNHEEIRVILDIRELVNNKLMKIIRDKRETDKIDN